MGKNELTIVSGIPRSGTSMMMNMLEAGGIPCLTDGVRKPDQGNPNGYFELEAIRRIEEDVSFIEQARGKALKIICFMLYHLPLDGSYQVVFMRRNMQEILASQREMLARMQRDPGRLPDSQWAKRFHEQQDRITEWMAGHSNFRVLYVDFNKIIKHPVRAAQELKSFLGCSLDLDSMARVVDPRLYRHRL